MPLISQAAKQKCFVSYATLWLLLLFKNKNVVVKISKKSDIKQRVNYLTFKLSKNGHKKDFSVEAHGQGYIVLLVCKVWCDILEGMKLDQEG